jgi:hypothetical protein
VHYAFSTSGRTGYEEAIRRLLRNRQGTELVNRRGLVTVEGFVDHLENHASVLRPVDDILIASHGNDHGYLQIDLDREPRGTPRRALTDPEELIDADLGDTVDLPAGLTNPGSIFYIRGCKVGQDIRFLDLFHAALGGNVKVNAPIFFHFAYFYDRLGVFEAFLYDFQHTRLEPFQTRAEVIAEFDAAGLTLVDGTVVPNNLWAGWVPRRFNAKKLEIPTTVRLGQQVGSRRTLTVKRRYAHTLDTYTYDITVTGGPVPSGQAAREQLLRQVLTGDPNFDPGHPYPVYERHDRLGFTSAARDRCTDPDDFVDSFKWRFRVRGNVLTALGRRHRYTIGPPVTHPGSGNLVFNFYPDATSSVPLVRQVADNDADYFAEVP